jgi:hypothetical protein
MLFGTQILPMVDLIATPVGRYYRDSSPAGRGRRLSPSRGTGAGGRGDRRPDGLPVARTVAEPSSSSWKG